MLLGGRSFLSRVVPWPDHGDDWWINLHHMSALPSGKRVVAGRAFKAFNDFVGYLEWRVAQGFSGDDIYVCMSGQRTTQPPTTNAKGKVTRKAARTAADAVRFKGIWLDVDVKPEFFATTEEAVAAFTEFCAKVGLPKPSYMVASGSGGFHAHWVLDEPIDQLTWQGLSRALSNACRSTGFKVDANVITNPVQILRIPDTLNWKTQPPRSVTLAYQGPIYSLTRLQSALGPFSGPLSGVSQNPALGATRPAHTSPIAKLPPREGADRKAMPSNWAMPSDPLPKPSLDEVIDGGCGWLEHVAATGGADQIEPLWRLALTVAFYTSDGNDAAHDLSSGHPGYQPSDTDEKYARVEMDQATGRYGWPQCSTIYGYGADQCKSCPHLQRGRSPLNFAVASTSQGNPGAAPLPSPQVLPQPGVQPAAPSAPVNDLDGTEYQRDPDDLVFRLVDDPDGEGQKRAYAARLPIRNLRSQRAKHGGQGEYTISFDTDLSLDETDKEVSFDYGFVDARVVLGALEKQGFVVSPDCRKYFVDLMTSFVEQLRKKRVIPTEQIGWSTDEKSGEIGAFVYNNMRWNCVGDTPVAPADPKITGMFMPTGQMKPWQDATKLIFNRGRPDLETILASAFAGPLIQLTGHAGIIMSAYSSESGVGKTTAMKTGAAVWGDPVRSQGRSSTENYLDKLMSTIRHLTMFYDELRMQNEVAKFVEFMFSIGQGKGKGRLKATAAASNVDTYNALLMAASNSSLVGYISDHTRTTTAGLLRVFEFEANLTGNGNGLISPPEAQRMLGALDYNYGHAGLEYAKFLGKNIEDVKKIVKESGDLFSDMLDATNEERFWIGAVSTIRAGAKLANNLGLTQFDMPTLVPFLVEQFLKLRKNRRMSDNDVTTPASLVNLVGSYVNEHRNQMLVTDKVWRQQGRPTAGFQVLIRNTESLRTMRGVLSVHAATDDDLLRISVTDFYKWLRRQEIQPSIIGPMLLKKLGAKVVQGRIGAGTSYALSKERLYEFDLQRHPDLFEDK